MESAESLQVRTEYDLRAIIYIRHNILIKIWESMW